MEVVWRKDCLVVTRSSEKQRRKNKGTSKITGSLKQGGIFRKQGVSHHG